MVLSASLAAEEAAPAELTWLLSGPGLLLHAVVPISIHAKSTTVMHFFKILTPFIKSWISGFIFCPDIRYPTIPELMTLLVKRRWRKAYIIRIGATHIRAPVLRYAMVSAVV